MQGSGPTAPNKNASNNLTERRLFSVFPDVSESALAVTMSALLPSLQIDTNGLTIKKTLR
jgi:hypothetical protein